MKALLAPGLALALLTGTAFAQTPPQTPPAAPASAEAPGVPHAPPPPPPGDHGGWDHEAGDMGPDHHWHHPMPRPSKAARFHIEAGDVNLGIKCPDDEPMKACADFTLQLLDKAGSLPQRQ